MPDIAHYLLEHFAFLAPVVNDIVLYLDEVTDHDLAISLRPRLEAIIGLEAMARQLVRFWIENYIARYPEYMASHALAKFIYGGPNIENHALVAITTKNVAWVRAHKASIYNLGGWARRAVLNASRVLPRDERNHWLKLCANNSPLVLDRWVAAWVEAAA